MDQFEQMKLARSLDVDGDGLITYNDVSSVYKLLGKDNESKDWDKYKKADLNLDGKVTEEDVKIVQDKLDRFSNFPYQHVFVIGLDGAGNYIKDANAPNIKNFIKESAYTYHAKATPPTMSGPNWGGIIHGVPKEKTGLTNDSVESERFPLGSPYPSFFKLLKQERPQSKSASFVNWEPINHGIVEKSIGVHKVSSSDDELTTDIVNHISQEGTDTRITFVQLDDIDAASHSHGWRSNEYYKQIEKTDENVGKILNSICDAGIMNNSLIIITTDHGGIEQNHGGDSPEEQTVFWAAHGPGIRSGKITAPVRNMDTAAVVSYAIRLDMPPTWDAEIPKGIFE